MLSVIQPMLSRISASMRGPCGAWMSAWMSALLTLGVADAAPLVVATTENPPFSYSDSNGNIVGMSADIVTEMGRRADVPMDINSRLPWMRAYRTTQTHPGTCAFSVSRLPERETLFHWIGPIASNKWALFARGDFTDRLSSLEDAKKYRIGGLLGDAKAAFLQARGLAVDTVPNDKLNPGKLAAGRIDLWASGLYSARETAKNAGVSDIKLVLIFNAMDSYLVCNRQVPQDVIGRLTHALDLMRKDGFVKKIHDDYNHKFTR